MTDKFAALTVLGDMQQKERDLAFYTFYEDSMGELLACSWPKHSKKCRKNERLRLVADKRHLA